MYHMFALKSVSRDDYIDETQAYMALRGRQGIVQCLAFWELKKPDKPSEYHLLLEYGFYDLDEYFENCPPPSLVSDVVDFWKSLSNVVPALASLHNRIDGIGGEVTHFG